jgi:tetratricopeptide (TPR) repeat protein
MDTDKNRAGDGRAGCEGLARMQGRALPAPGIVRLWLLMMFMVAGRAEATSFTNSIVQGDVAEKRGDVAGAMKAYTAADSQALSCGDLCVVTRRYCDLMHDASSPAVQRDLAEKALASGLRAEKADQKSALAHLSVAVCYAKNFPYADNETKVKWSRAMKTECEQGIALDPKQDVGYYLLGRWYFGAANMNFFAKGVVKLIYGGLPQASNEDAIKNFKQAIALAPDRIIHHSELARVYEATGDKKLAIAELEKCARLKPVDRDDQDAKEDAAGRLKALK